MLRQWLSNEGDKKILRIFKAMAQEQAVAQKMFVYKIGGETHSVMYGWTPDVIEYRKDKKDNWHNTIEIDCYCDAPRLCFRDNEGGVAAITLSTIDNNGNEVSKEDNNGIFIVALNVFNTSGARNTSAILEDFYKWWGIAK